MATKTVTFMNVDTSTGYFYEGSIEATVLTGLETSLSSGVYIVEGNVTINHLYTNGDVKIILADGCNYTTSGVSVSGNLTIYGQAAGSGTLTANAEKLICQAGINVTKGNTLTIVGGNVKAYGVTGGSGIGCGPQGDVDGITIWGGNVYAKGGGDGAGIGSANGGVASNITIHSGVVTAYGGINYAAGIGGGNYGSAYNITIMGGDVYAKGGGSGAGIGSGTNAYNYDTNQINISGGHVTAHGTNDNPEGLISVGASGAGIGGGWESGVSTINITGGYTVAEDENCKQASSIGGGGGTDLIHSEYQTAEAVYVNEDVKLTIDGNEISHTSTVNLAGHFTRTTSATMVMQNNTVSTEIELKNETYTQSGSYYGNGGYYNVTATGKLIGGDAAECISLIASFKDNVINNTLAQGGAIYNAGTLSLYSDSDQLTFTGNKAIGNSEGAQGGAIYNTGTTTISNVAFADNYATCWKGTSVGGAIYNAKGATLSLANVKFEDNKATTAGGAIYNAGTLNLDGAITLSTSTDTLYNAGSINWDLSKIGTVDGYELVTNAEDSTRVITIDNVWESELAEEGRSYSIATGDFSNIDLTGTKFTLTGIDGRNDVVLTVNGNAVGYGDSGIMYVLSTETDGNKDTLSLKAVNTNKILVTTGEKWFRQTTDETSPSYPAEVITISGIVTGDLMDSITITGYGETKTVTVGEDKKWSVTLPYDSTIKDTAGTTLTITGFQSSAPNPPVATTAYTLKVDTADPEVVVTLSKQGYVKEGDDVHWYKVDDDVSFSATVTDATSGVRVVKLNAQNYGIDETGKGENVTLETSVETPSKMQKLFVAQDNASNATAKSFYYQVDGTAPVISVAVFVAGGTTAYTDDNGIGWFKEGTADAALKTVIVDQLSGLKSASYAGVQYEDGCFAIDAETETNELVTSVIMAVDNVNNSSVSKKAYSYGVDGTGPEIGDGTFEGESRYIDANGKSWFKKGDTTAALVIDITDSLSGLNSATFAGAEYKDGKFMLAEATPTEDCKIVAIDNVGNVSEKSKTAAEAYYKVGIDGEGPTITVTANPATDLTSGKVTFTVNATDEESGVSSVGYSFDNNEWIWLSGDTVTFDVDQNKVIYVAAYDNVYNMSTDSYQVANICKNGDDYVAIGEISVAAGDNYRLNSITLTDGSSFTLGVDSSVYVKTITMQGGELDVAAGTMLAETLIVESGDANQLVGVVGDASRVSNILIESGATLTVSKDQFDALMTFTDYVSLGKLYVSTVEGNALTESDIKALIGKTGVGTVSFAQDLNEIHNLTVDAGKTGMIQFHDGYGTDKGDVLRAAKGASLVFGNLGYTIDLGKGSNKLQVDDSASFALKSNLENVSTVRIGNDARVELNGNLTFADEHDASLKVGRNSIVTFMTSDAAISGGNKKLTLSLDKASSLMANNITANAANDRISTGNSASFTSAQLTGIETISLGQYSKNGTGDITGTKNLTISNGSTSGCATLKAGTITGIAGVTNSYSFGNYNTVVLDDITTQEKNDTVKVGKDSIFTAKVIELGEGKNKLEIGSRSTATFTSASGLNMLTLSNGSYDKKTAVTSYTSLTAEKVTGTSANDSFNFGNYSDVELKSGVSLGEGNDMLKIGSDSAFNATEILFGAGNDTFSIGNRSEAVVTGNVSDVYKLTLSNGSYDQKTAVTSWTKLTVDGAVTGTEKNDNFNFGNYSNVDLKSGASLGEGNDTLKIGSDSTFAATSIEFADGNDKLSVGKNSSFKVDSISGADTIELSAYSTSTITGNIVGTKKLTISNGNEEQFATLSASAVTGTAENDNFNLGNWNEVDFDSLKLGDGDDTLKIGSYAHVDIETLDFGDGDKDKLTICKGATLSVKSLDVDTLDTLSMDKDSRLVIANADDLADAKEKWSTYSDQIVSKLA